MKNKDVVDTRDKQTPLIVALVMMVGCACLLLMLFFEVCQPPTNQVINVEHQPLLELQHKAYNGQ